MTTRDPNVGCVIRRRLGVDAPPVCDLQLEPLPMPEPKAGEVLIAVKAVGICGSDVHYWQHGHIGDFIVDEKLVLGHETAGVVIALGEGVADLQINDRVAMEPGVACGQCVQCKTGRYNLCPKICFWATPPYDGSLCRYVVHPAAYCFKLPPSMILEDGAMLEPFSVSLYPCRRAGVSVGTSMLIMGAGPIGLMCVLAAKAFGASKIVVVDLEAARLDVAKRCGATTVVQASNEPTFKVKDHLTSAPDVTMECTGAEACISMAIEATASGGKVVAIGCGPAYVTVPLIQASTREVDILGNFRYCNTWPLGIEMVSSGKVNFTPLITHRYALDDPVELRKAFDCTLLRRDDAGVASIKVVLTVS